jgi:hypothetical protein
MINKKTYKKPTMQVGEGRQRKSEEREAIMFLYSYIGS